jgi:hypothetical protein
MKLFRRNPVATLTFWTVVMVALTVLAIVRPDPWFFIGMIPLISLWVGVPYYWYGLYKLRRGEWLDD